MPSKKLTKKRAKTTLNKLNANQLALQQERRQALGSLGQVLC